MAGRGMGGWASRVLDPAGFPSLRGGVKHLFSIGPWLMELFNPPLRESLSLRQKIGRVLLVTVTLVTLSIIMALVLALVLYAYQFGGNVLMAEPQLTRGLEILAVSVAVNVVCVLVLLQVKRLDQRLVPPTRR
jgi:hypothetical protein